MIFEWDENNNAINQQKHGISFELASRIFTDPFLITAEDICSDELRWLSVGSVDGVAVLPLL
ncbi:MAG: BrnT family toxin [Moraxella sp.]|nr:BrnT family toxin [Moraxella sp.]